MGFFDTLLGNDAADAAKAAAADTYQKQRDAVRDILNYGDRYKNDYAALSQKFQPYAAAGNSALAQLMAGLGLAPGGESFTAAYRSLPGYQAGLDTGSRAITGNAAARGMLNSGATLKALDKFGMNYEGQKSGDYLSRLLGLTNIGQTATGQEVATAGTGLQGQLNTRTTAYGGDMASAGTIGQGDIAAANAQAAGVGNIMNIAAKLAGAALGGGMGGFGGGFSAGMSPGFASGASTLRPYG